MTMRMKWGALGAAVVVVLGTSPAFAVPFAPGTSFSIDFETARPPSGVIDVNGGIDDPGDLPLVGPGQPSAYGPGVPITETSTGGDGVFNDRGFFDDRFGVGFTSPDAPLTLFDTNCATGTVTNPNVSGCTGDNPGAGDDGDLATGAPFDTPASGNILIAQEDSAQDSDANAFFQDPDDVAGGFDIVVEFLQSAHEFGATITEIILIDQEGTESVEFRGSRNGTKFFTIPDSTITVSNLGGANAPTAGDNAVLSYSFGIEAANLQAFEVIFTGSGGIEAVVFESSFEVIPLPPTIAMMLGGFGLLLWRKRAQRAQTRAA
ncbi:MAG: hypothetical protein AAF416_17300 [Pseudomonadota bacterium]